MVKRAAVLGWPVAHSLSPAIHSYWAMRERADARYEAIAVEPEDTAFATCVSRLRAEGFAGVNVTIPHKERALKIADHASDAARHIGAANMLTFTQDGVLAANSDATAISDIILGLPERPQRALVLGAGGAARAALWALARTERPPGVIVTNRTRARAEEIGGIAAAEIVDWADRNRAVADADLIINATSLGMRGQPALDLDYAALKPAATVFDIVYAPLETPLLKAAKARGLRVIDGLEMLMRQAAPAYRAWLGESAPVDAQLRGHLIAEIERRRS
jgi:shikimate dehydrogenase